MKVLAIGNSFSQDATRYLHQIAKADDMVLEVINLYIGGCSLETHHYNMINDLSAYRYEFNGVDTERMISIKEALLSDDWDVVTMQQASQLSTKYETYIPYIADLSDYISTYAPRATKMIHQTWAYEDNSERLTQLMGYRHSMEMFNDLKNAYDLMSKNLGGLQIIPSGRAFCIAQELGIQKIHRDTFHASYGLGRYILAGVWYELLTGNSMIDNAFQTLDEPVNKKDILLAKECIRQAVYEYTGKQNTAYAKNN